MTRAATGSVSGEAVGLRRVERFPIRRVLLVVISVATALFVVIGSWKTLTLPAGRGYSAGAWRDFLVLGVAQGAVFALIALGYSLVYGILRMINFAHGEVFMMGAYASYFFADAYGRSGFLDRSPVLALLILFVVAIVVSSSVAVLLERVAYRPLRRAPRLVPLITAIGASLFLQHAALGLFGAQTQGYPRPDALKGSWSILGVPVGRVSALVVLVSAIMVLILSYFVRSTKLGKSMRAAAEDQEIASLMGIDVDRVIMLTFAVGGVLAGVAGVLFALRFQFVHYSMGFAPGIAAFTAAVLGGIGSIAGAALGGLVLGVLQSIGPALFLSGFHVPSPFQLKDVVTFSVLVLVLIFRPGGILDREEVQKL
jgi:branched-chain amino acid transport system permease protein